MNKENLINIIQNSKTKKEVLEKLNLRAAGGNYSVLSAYIKDNNIDISHFLPHKDRILAAHIKNTIPLEKILIENSSYTNRKKIKSRLYKLGIKKEICEFCSQGPI